MGTVVANQKGLHSADVLRHDKSSCLLLGVMALGSAVGLPIVFVLFRLAMLFVSPASTVDSVYSPFASVGFNIWLCATPLISIIALWAGRSEIRRHWRDYTCTNIGIIISFVSLAVWTMPAIVIVLGMITGAGR